MRRFSLALTFLIFLAIFIVLIGLIIYPPLPALATSLASPEIRFAIVLSLVTSTVSTAICVVLAIPAAYALARYNFPLKKLVNLVLTIPLALPPLVAGIALLLFFGTTSWGKALDAMGFEVVFTPLGIIIAEVFVNLPYMIRILKSSYAAINPRYENVAKTLGCTEIGAFLQVTFPLARPGLVAGTTITWAKSMGEFGAVSNASRGDNNAYRDTPHCALSQSLDRRPRPCRCRFSNPDFDLTCRTLCCGTLFRRGTCVLGWDHGATC